MNYDLAVIGGGPAGYTAAFEAARHGMGVALFEEKEVGGTCLNRGCVPTKFLAHAAELYAHVGRMDEYGIHVSGKGISFPETCERKDEIVSELRGGLSERLRSKKIDIIPLKAVIRQPGEVAAGGESYHVGNILVCTGASPAKPFVEGALTTDGLLSLQDIPDTLKIIGGGITAVEFAHIYAALGTEVTVCIRGDRLLRKLDREIGMSLMRNFRNRGIVVRTGCSREELSAKEAGVILSAIGRTPNISGLGLEKLGAAVDGGIVTDPAGCTNIQGIYAAGDVVKGSRQLAHEAMYQGKRAVCAMLGGVPPAPRPLPRCIYTEPEIATVGLSEDEAKAEGTRVKSGKALMSANARTAIATKERGFVKLVADAASGKLVGAHLMCERASDLVSEAAMAIDMGMTAGEFADFIRPHPSFCEAYTEAAEALREKME